MERDGWVLMQEGAFHSTRDGRRTERPEIWERRNTDGSILLRRSTDAISFRHPGGPYVESFRLVLSSGAELPQGLRTTFSCVFEGFLRELSRNHIINTNCDVLYSPIHYRKVANM